MIGTELSIIPLCLYSPSGSAAKVSLLSLPRIQRENDTNHFICPARENLGFATTIYVIDPDIRPIPKGLDLFCVKNGGEITLSVETQYDPFNIDDNCLRFMAWLEPTPNTIPLFLYDTGNGVYISLKKLKNVKKAKVPVIHVLQNPNTKFIVRDGRCIPSVKNGYELRNCSIEANFPKEKNMQVPNSFTVADSNSSYKDYSVLWIILLLFFIAIIILWLSKRRKKRKR